MNKNLRDIWDMSTINPPDISPKGDNPLTSSNINSSNLVRGMAGRTGIEFVDGQNNSFVTDQAVEMPEGTFMALLKLTSLPGVEGHNFDLYIAHGTPDKGFEITLSDCGPTDVSIAFTGEKNEDWDTYRETDIGNYVSVNSWFYLAVSWNFSEKDVQFYINGEQLSGSVGDSLDQWDELFTPEKYIIGTEASPHDDRDFLGVIDSISISDSILTPSKISEISVNLRLGI